MNYKCFGCGFNNEDDFCQPCILDGFCGAGCKTKLDEDREAWVKFCFPCYIKRKRKEKYKPCERCDEYAIKKQSDYRWCYNCHLKAKEAKELQKDYLFSKDQEKLQQKYNKTA